MGTRGRPKTPDILTPREYEVLALLRRGCSNREIAQELGVSLAGAKFHVSEIIGKLGVANREQAAVWRPEGTSRRWGFVSLVDLSSWVSGVSGLLTPKVVAVTLGLVVMVGVTAGVIVAITGEDGSTAPALIAVEEPTPTPELPAGCLTTSCMTMERVQTEVASIEEAAALASFEPRLPTSIPEGFDELRLLHSRPGPAITYYPDGRTEESEPFANDPYSDLVSAIYRDADDGYLAVTQGYYHVAPTGIYDKAPADMRGVEQLHGKELRWVRGGPPPVKDWEPSEHGGVRPIYDGGWEDGSIALYWTMSAIETAAWEISPDGVRRDVTRPLEYMVRSNALSLEELLEIAASVLE